MKTLKKTLLIIISLLMFTLSATAAEQVSDQELVNKQAEFKQFAQTKVKQLNRNHNLSRDRMQVTKQADGSYRAIFHQIDNTSLTVKVRRSQSKTIPYVGVLSYQEQVFEAISASPDNFDPDEFVLAQIIPNKHIFSYRKGTWN